MKPNPRLRGLAAGLLLIQYAGATDYQFNSVTAPFSTGFTPALTGGGTTTADKLILSGTDVSYTATDDLTGITVNSEVINSTAAALQTQLVARGGGDNLITLGGTTPYLSFANTASSAVVENLDHTFTADGFVTKLAGQAVAGANPVMNGGLNLGTNSVTFAIADSGGDGQAELTMNGLLTGSGALVLDNANATAGVGAPGAATPDWGTLQLSANNSAFTGPVTLTKGRLVVNNDNAAGTGLITVGGLTNSGGVLSLGGNNANAAVQNYGGLQGAATGFTLQNNINLGGETSGNYGQGLINNSGSNTLSGVVTLQQPQVNIQVNNLSTLTLSNGIGENAAGNSIVKSGNGTLVLTNAAYTGSTTVNAGNVAFNGTAPAAGTITMVAGAGLNVGTAGNAFPTVASALASGRISPFTAGSIALTGSHTEALNLTGFAGLGIGATAEGADYSGVLTVPGAYRLGGGGGVLTISGTNTLTGGKIVQILNGPVVLAGANNFTGGLNLTSSSLTLGAAGAIGTSGFITFGGGTLKFSAANTTDYSSRFSTSGAPMFNFDTNGQNVQLANNFIGSGGQLLKAGTGNLTLGNGTSSNYGTGNLFVEGGTLILPNGTNVTNSGGSSIGHLNGQTGTLTLQGTANLTTTGDFNIGDLAVSNGALNIAGTGAVKGGTTYLGRNGASTGLLNITGGGSYTQVGGGDTRIGGGTSANDVNSVGIVRLTNGSFTTPSNFQIGANGRGAFLQSGGTATITGGYPSIGRYPGGYGVFDISGGNVNYAVGGTGNRFIVGEQGTGILNVRGSGTLNCGSTSTTTALTLGNNSEAGSVGFVNLLSGGTINTLSVGKLGAAATATFNFNGGTLKARGSNASFMVGLDHAYVFPGNAVIDTNGFNVTISQPLLPPTGGGVTSIAFTGGSGFTAPPIVQLTGGDGTGATAVATIDGSGNLTGFVITNPGVNYTVPPTVTLYNVALAAGGALPTGLSAALANNSSGGLVKNGLGTLTLTGFNSYTGPTTVNEGTLSVSADYLADTSSVTIGANGVLDLPLGLVDQVASLTINGVSKPLGFYDANTDPGFITGTGQIEVIGTPTATGYDAFKANPANGLTAGVNDGPKDDPDADGIANLLEFVFGGIPAGAGASNRSIVPTQTLTPTSLIVTFNRVDDSEGDVTLKVQWSGDLVTWGAPKEISIGPATAGIVAVTENGSAADTVTVTIPRSGNEVNGKLYARVISSRP